jgi:peptidyl-tRNA hydrolase
MYFVVRKDVRLTLAQGMALAGGATVLCADTFRTAERWAPAFAAWGERPRKVALRASAEELDALRDELDHVAVADGALICLPPRRMSERSELLAGLRPFTDARAPAEPPPSPARPALTYVVRPSVMKTLGKAMAQAGHAALLAADTLGDEHGGAFSAWRAAGRAGEVRAADDAAWQRLKAAGAVAVADAGLTQVEPGTETVLALAPADEPPGLVAGLELCR